MLRGLSATAGRMAFPRVRPSRLPREAWLIEGVRSHNAVVHAALPWLRQLDPLRRRVIENTHFNMGWDNPKTPEKEGLSGFMNTLAHVQGVGLRPAPPLIQAGRSSSRFPRFRP